MRWTVVICMALSCAALLLICPGCGRIEGLSLPRVDSPRATVATPESPASGNVILSFCLIDREKDPCDVELEYSADGGQTFIPATLVNPAAAVNLQSSWHPGSSHAIEWDSVADGLAISGGIPVRVKITPSDAGNPAGAPGLSGAFTLDNTAYNQRPAATVAAPAGVQSGNIQINYFLADVESDDCEVTVLFSTNDGTTCQAATRGSAGEGLTGLASSPSGTAHSFLWNSRADAVALSGQLDSIRIKITPTDFNTGTPGETASFSVDNTIVNDPPVVAITDGPADGSTVYTTQVAFTWSGSDTDGTVIGYYYSFDHDPPDTWTTGTSATSSSLSEGPHTFRVVAVDDEYDLSAVASRSFTVEAPGTIQADFTASPTSGPTPLAVSFTDQSTATHGIDTWLWSFGDGATSNLQDPAHTYTSEGVFSVALTVTGPDGSDTESKPSFISVGDVPLHGYAWAHRIGGTDGDRGKVARTDAAGSLYVTGQLGDGFSIDGYSADFAEDWGGSDPKTGKGKLEIFLTKVDSAGSYCWTRLIGGTDYDYIYDMCIDAAGNIYLVGYFQSININFARDWGGVDAKSPSGSYDGFVTKVNADGSYGWTRKIGGSDRDKLYAVGTDSSLNVYVAGTFGSNDSSYSVNFAADWAGSDTKTRAGTSGDDAFITKIDASGSYCWTRRIGSEASDSPWAICADSFDNIYLAGQFGGHFNPTNFAADWGGTDTRTNSTADDVFLTKIAANGSYAWTHTWGGDETVYVYRALADANDNILLSGSFRGGTVNFAADWTGSDSKTVSGGYMDGYVLKIDPAGSYCWTRAIGGPGNYDGARDICVDSAGNIYAAGDFEDTSNFAADWGSTDNKTSAGSIDAYITRINADGSYGWSYRMGASEADSSYTICSDPDDNIYVAGFFKTTVNFAADWGATDTKITAGSDDVFILKLSQP